MKARMARPASSDALYLQRLQDHYARHRVIPAYTAIGAIVGLRSKSSVSAWLQRLRDAGLIDVRHRRIVPLARFFERPRAASRVSAGLPMAAVDGPDDGLGIDSHLVRHPSRTFLVAVQGESMTGAGLLPGDTVIAESRTDARPGQIVIANVDGEFTIKRLARERGRLVLRPENDAFPVIRPDPLQIVGIAVGAFRRYA